jgi:hypothetical protein
MNRLGLAGLILLWGCSSVREQPGDTIQPWVYEDGGVAEDWGGLPDQKVVSLALDLAVPEEPDGPAPLACNMMETPFDGHCYSTPGIKWLTYETGKQLCTGQGGQVVTIDSDAENQFVYQLLPPTTQAAWIGLRRTGTGVYDHSWESGQSITYQLWADGEPNNEGSDEDCTVIWGPFLDFAELQGKWNDVPCETPGRDTVICERIP